MTPEQEPLHPTVEWLEADGLGGFANGTVSGIRTRRYHALLLTATTPPAGRMVLINGFDAWVKTSNGVFPISSQRYQPDVIHPDGVARLIDFQPEPWPRWVYQIEEGLLVEQEAFVPRGASVTVLRWRLSGNGPASLMVRPFLSGRDFHATHHENGVFNFTAEVAGDRVTWSPYPGVPRVTARSNGQYRSQPDWYRNFAYSEEQARGLDFIEDLAAPGMFEFDLGAGRAELVLAAEGHEAVFSQSLDEIACHEQARRIAFPSRLHKAADAYLAQRRTGKTIIAGYPWFGDWGRDTFIALRGLCFTTGRYEDARDILVEWAGTVSEGMLPNRFPDKEETPEFNSVDASLWYVIASHELLQTASSSCTADHIGKIESAIEAILDGYSKGTRFGIRLDECGLLACGVPGVQLTWMDAKVGDWVVTPRIGKPVEVQALWLNALWVGAQRSSRWKSLFDSGLQSFRSRFWNEARRCLFDVIDCEHQHGTLDASLRPNQIFAVGGLPLCLLEDEPARAVVDAVEASLLTPKGLRSLGPQEPNYHARYEGGVVQRDGSYHQGTVWPWLMGPFVEAWLRVRSYAPSAVEEGRNRFLPPFYEHLNEAGLGHVSEITDAEAPYTPRGCPFQAWSLGELLRIENILREVRGGSVGKFTPLHDLRDRRAAPPGLSR
jgi:predicted glycogen debranching enzyme